MKHFKASQNVFYNSMLLYFECYSCVFTDKIHSLTDEHGHVNIIISFMGQTKQGYHYDIDKY